jgi:hypothetical protein
MFLAADILGLGHSISSFGQTLALAITFLGIGVLANVLIVYAVAAAKKERDQNVERIAAYDAAHPDDFDPRKLVAAPPAHASAKAGTAVTAGTSPTGQ